MFLPQSRMCQMQHFQTLFHDMGNNSAYIKYQKFIGVQRTTLGIANLDYTTHPPQMAIFFSQKQTRSIEGESKVFLLDITLLGVIFSYLRLFRNIVLRCYYISFEFLYQYLFIQYISNFTSQWIKTILSVLLQQQ